MLARTEAELLTPRFLLTRVLRKHPETLARLSDREAELFKSLIKTLHEYQRLQAARAGQVVPAPRRSTSTSTTAVE